LFKSEKKKKKSNFGSKTTIQRWGHQVYVFKNFNSRTVQLLKNNFKMNSQWKFRGGKKQLKPVYVKRPLEFKILSQSNSKSYSSFLRGQYKMISILIKMISIF
jgi:hypothetical protein